MKKTLLFIISILIPLYCDKSLAANFSNEKLHYVISYKWGLIHKDAGDATLTLKHKGNNYDVVLAAKTKPWADRFYEVRDTLLCTMKTEGLDPVSYKKITHEKGKHSRDEISYTKMRGVTKGDVVRYRIRDGKWKALKSSLTASGPVFDMLSIFYYLRTLDYDRLAKGNYVYKATVFSGKKAETISIRCLGKEKIKLRDKTQREGYKILFNFTTDGGHKSSDDMTTWISTDSSHIPLYLVGKLPIGEVRAYYTGRS